MTKTEKESYFLGRIEAMIDLFGDERVEETSLPYVALEQIRDCFLKEMMDKKK